jgi:hypothetical protein
MAAKQLVFGEEARRKLKNGIEIVASAVVTTLALKVATWPLTANSVHPPLLTMVSPWPRN